MAQADGGSVGHPRRAESNACCLALTKDCTEAANKTLGVVIDLNAFAAALITALHFFGQRHQRFLPFACTLSLRAALRPNRLLVLLEQIRKRLVGELCATHSTGKTDQRTIVSEFMLWGVEHSTNLNVQPRECG